MSQEHLHTPIAPPEHDAELESVRTQVLEELEADFRVLQENMEAMRKQEAQEAFFPELFTEAEKRFAACQEAYAALRARALQASRDELAGELAEEEAFSDAHNAFGHVSNRYEEELSLAGELAAAPPLEAQSPLPELHPSALILNQLDEQEKKNAVRRDDNQVESENTSKFYATEETKKTPEPEAFSMSRERLKSTDGMEEEQEEKKEDDKESASGAPAAEGTNTPDGGARIVRERIKKKAPETGSTEQDAGTPSDEHPKEAAKEGGNNSEQKKKDRTRKGKTEETGSPEEAEKFKQGDEGSEKRNEKASDKNQAPKDGKGEADPDSLNTAESPKSSATPPSSFESRVQENKAAIRAVKTWYGKLPAPARSLLEGAHWAQKQLLAGVGIAATGIAVFLALLPVAIWGAFREGGGNVKDFFKQTAGGAKMLRKLFASKKDKS